MRSSSLCVPLVVTIGRYSLFVYLLVFCWIRQGIAQTDAPVQNWVLKSGKSIEARFGSYAENSVTLIDVDERRVTAQLNDLDAASQSRAMEIWFDRCDSEQFRMVRQHLLSINSRPEAVSQILKQIHESKPASPYAALWAAVGYSAGSNNLETAKQMIRQAIERIQFQRKFLPNRHTLTQSSAYNNYALISLKETGAAACAGQLIAATKDVALIPPVVLHNSQQLLEFASNGESRLELSTDARRRLTKAIIQTEVNNVSAEYSPGWYYTLDVDVPSDRLGAAQRVSGIDSPHAALELASSGTGLVVAPGLVLTAKDVIAPPAGSNVIHLTVGTLQDGLWKSLAIKGCLVTKATFQETERTVTVSSFGISFAATNFRTFEPIPNSIEDQLAGLHVPGLDVRPAFIDRETPKNSEVLELLGYNRGPTILKDGLVRIPGSVSSQPSQIGEQFATNDLAGGQIGAPLIRSQGTVAGMAFGLSPHSDGSGCRFFGGRVIHNWFSRNVPTSSLLTQLPPNVRQATESATIPIFGWSLKRSMSSFANMSDGSAPSESLRIRDDWCIQCSGLGVKRCTHCSNGTVSYKSREQVAFSSISGPIFGDVTKRKPCGDCDGKGNHDCLACKQGRY